MISSSLRTLTAPFLTTALVFAAACTGVDADTSTGDPVASTESPMQAPQAIGPLAEAAPRTVQPAALTGTLNCNLEYERFSPTFLTLPQVSFSQPMSVVATSGVSASNATFLLYAQINPSPPTNLSFEVGTIRNSTGKSLSYLVLPPPSAGGAFLFENGAQITTVTINGIAYDHIRTYCSLTP